MTKDEALRLALEALQFALHVGFDESSESQIKKGDKAGQQHRQAIIAIKAALEAKDEPWEKFCDSNCVWTDHHPDCKLAQRTWVGLTDEEIEQGCKESWVTEQAFQSAVWWAEAKLKEKNT
jgi:hypothetical protein